MFCYRITKYDPAFRDENGAFQGDEWISISDIGKKFSGRTFAFEEYFSVESKYVSSALHFFNEADFKSISIVGLEQKQDRKRNATDNRFSGIDYERNDFREGMDVYGSNLSQLCRLVLREIFWCRLESKPGFYIHFGYDFYMYIGTAVKSDSSVDFATKQGLFVEEMESPYSQLSDE